MTEKLHKKLNDSAAMRWGALFVVAFTMMAAYFVNDVMAPLKSMFESNLGWSSSEYGFFTGAYSFLNVFLLMLIWGGFILDKFGIRFTGILSTVLMVAGTAIEYLGITVLASAEGVFLDYQTSVWVASAGYAIFGVGAEVAGITVTKVIAKWFKGKEMATAMGVQVALARIGSQAAYALALPLAGGSAEAEGGCPCLTTESVVAVGSTDLSFPLMIGLSLLVLGMIAFLVFAVFDKRLDKQNEGVAEESGDEEKFSFKDVASILGNKGFWLIALLCVLFYSCVFPFQKFATEFFTLKYNMDASLAGTIAGLPALGALVLTPLFGGVVDKRGKAASIMMLGSAMLIFVHMVYAIPTISATWVAVALMLVLGVAFSLVPSAMWPSVAKIFPAHQLGTAYALIFFIQNIGLWGIPVLIGKVLDSFCKVEITDPAQLQALNGCVCPSECADCADKCLVAVSSYDYTLPMMIFTGLAVSALVIAFILKRVDKSKGYGLELPNIK